MAGAVVVPLVLVVVFVVVFVVVMVDLAKAFGKSGWFAVVLTLLPFVGCPMLAFGEARYVGPVADPAFARPGWGPVPAPNP